MRNNSTQTVNELLGIFEGFRMAPTAIDEYAVKGKQILANKMEYFIGHNLPIEFYMLGYPMKSVNTRDKVIGNKPDLAEEVSIKNFGAFGYKITDIYEPGIRINIVNDGLIFNDLLGAPTETVFDYKDITVDMSSRLGAPMQFYDLTDFYNRDSLDTGRVKLMEQHGITDYELENKIMFDADVNFLYRGMLHFMEEELAMGSYPSRNQLHKAAKKLTRNMMLRNEAYSNLANHEFGSTGIRLSMHPSVNNGGKYSFQLIPSDRAWTSPLHCALLIDSDGSIATVHRKDAEAAGYELVNVDGRPYYYQG